MVLHYKRKLFFRKKRSLTLLLSLQQNEKRVHRHKNDAPSVGGGRVGWLTRDLTRCHHYPLIFNASLKDASALSGP